METTAIQKIVPPTMESLKSTGIASLLESYRTQIQKAIPNNITPERIIQIATSVINQNPEIKKCSTSSIIGAVLESAILGFDPTPALGLCAFIPRYNGKTKKLDCQFMIEYQGYITLARNSGEIASVYAQVVHENDLFEYEYGLAPKLTHKPAKGNRGEMKYAYAVWYFKDGTSYFEVMDAEEIGKVRAKSQAKDSEFSPWSTFPSEMWRKSVIRRSRKYVPLSLETNRKLAVDEAVIEPEQIVGGETDLPAIETTYEEVETAGKPKVKQPQAKAEKKCCVCGKSDVKLTPNDNGDLYCEECGTKAPF